MTDRYAVFGNPISHSKSPAIHQAFAQACQQDMHYEAICAPLDDFKGAVEAFILKGGKGLNVTVPFKEEAWQLAKVRSPRAELAGAINTLYLNDAQQLCGDNTDGIGLVRDICVNHHYSISGKRVLVLGAGGAVRGVLQPILEQSPSEVVIANRTVSKADALVTLFDGLGDVRASAFEALEGEFDLIINGTAASLQGELPPLPSGLVGGNTWCYDMMYGADITPFNQWAKTQGAAQQLDGLGMLVEQAAEAFSIWRGVRPATDDVIRAIRNQLLTA